MHPLLRWPLSPLWLLSLSVVVLAAEEPASGDSSPFWHPPYLVVDVPHQPQVLVVLPAPPLPWQPGYWHLAPSPPLTPSPPGVFQRHGMWRDEVASSRPDDAARRIESHAGGTITSSRSRHGSRIETHPGGSVIRSRPRGE